MQEFEEAKSTSDAMERLDRFFFRICMDGTSVSCKSGELSARSRNFRCWFDELARGLEAHQSLHLVSTTCKPIATCFVSMADRRIEPFAPRYRYHIEEWIDISVRFRSIPSPPDGLGRRPSLWFFQSKPGSTRVERGRNRVQPEIEGNETEGVDRHERRTCARQAWSATRRPLARRPWCRKTPGRCRRSCSRWWVPERRSEEVPIGRRWRKRRGRLTTCTNGIAQNVEEYEPRVVQQLLDFMYRHVNEVLEDAEVRAGEPEDEGKETRRDEWTEAELTDLDPPTTCLWTGSNAHETDSATPCTQAGTEGSSNWPT